MLTECHVRLCRNGRNQALRIPREFELDAREAIVYRDGERLIIQPVKGRGLLTTLASLPDLGKPFVDVDAGLLPLDDIAL